MRIQSALMLPLSGIDDALLLDLLEAGTLLGATDDLLLDKGVLLGATEDLLLEAGVLLGATEDLDELLAGLLDAGMLDAGTDEAVPVAL
jgi:hypothetical protein